MAASKIQMNTRACSFTPTSGTAILLSGVSNVSVDPQGNLNKFSADGDLFPTLTVHDYSDPMVTLTLANINAALSCGVGTRGSMSVTFKDAKNQAAGSGTGDITFTVSPAIVQNIPSSQGYRQFGTATLTFASESVDGVTSPISFTVA